MAGVTRAGRPSRFTPDTKEKILKALRAGNTHRAAAAFARISDSTLAKWTAQGRAASAEIPALEAELESLKKLKPTKRNLTAFAKVDAEIDRLRPWAEFSDAIEHAEGDAETHYVSNLAQAAQGGYVIREKTVTRTLKDGTEETTTERVFAPKDSRATMFWLERRRHDEFGRKEQIALTGEDGGPVQIIGYDIVAPAVIAPVVEAAPEGAAEVAGG